MEVYPVMGPRKRSADDIICRRRSSLVTQNGYGQMDTNQKPYYSSPQHEIKRSDKNRHSSSRKKTLEAPMIRIQQPSVDISDDRYTRELNGTRSYEGSPERDNLDSKSDKVKKFLQWSQDLELYNGTQDGKPSNRRNSITTSGYKITSPRRSADNIFAARRNSNNLLEMYNINPSYNKKRNSADHILQRKESPWAHRKSVDSGALSNRDYWVRCGRYDLPLTMRDAWYDNCSDSNLQAAVGRVSLRKNGRRRSSEPMKPPCPPSPALQHLTCEELKILNTVIHKQEKFEQEETSRTVHLQKELRALEERVKHAAANKSVLKQVDLRLCRLCFKTQFADGIGRACYDCHRRVCNRCGTFSKASWDGKRNKLIRGKWRCSLCYKRREILMATGMWYHGDDAQPTLNSSVFQKKLGDSGPDSDWIPSGEHALSDSSCRREYSMLTDSEMSAYSASRAEQELRGCPRRLPRRRLLSSEEFSDMLDDEEELDIDDEQFLIERQKSRRERVKYQKKIGKRRSRKVSVGTCTEEDGIITEDVPSMIELELCPMHGSQSDIPSPPNKERKVSFKDDEKNKGLKTGKESRSSSKESMQRRSGVISKSGSPFVVSHSGKAVRAEFERSRHTLRNASFTSDPGKRPHHKTSANTLNSNYTHSNKDCSKLALSQNDLNPKSVKSANSLLQVEEKEEIRRSSAPSRLDQNKPDNDSKENISKGYYGKRHRVSAEIHMPRRSLSLEEDKYKDRRKEPNTNYSYSREGVSAKQGSPSFPLRAIPANVYNLERRRGSCDGRKYSPTITKRLVSQTSVDAPYEPSHKTSDEWLNAKRSPNNRTRYKKLSPSMRFASVEDGLSPSPSAEFENGTEYFNTPGVSIKIYNSHYQEQSLDNNMRYPNTSAAAAAASFTSSHVGGGLYSGASSENVPLFHLQGVPLCHTSTTEFDESASTVSSKNSSGGGGGTRRNKLPAKPKMPYYEERTQHYADEVSFEGLPSFLANPITSEDQLKQEHLLPTQSKASFRNASFGNQEKVKLCKNPNDINCRTNGLGMVVIGGKQDPDGKLGAYVTEIIPGGSADMCGICVGDQILEWDGSSLVDATYEEVREVTERSGDTVQLVVMYNRHLQTLSPKLKEESPLPVAKKLVPQESMESAYITGQYGRRNGGLGGVLPSDIWNPKPVKRTLPRTPEELKKLQPSTKGKIELRLWHDMHAETLAVHVIKAKDLTLATKNGVKITKFIIRVKMLPFEVSSETPEFFIESQDTNEPVWDKTVIYRDFGICKLDESAVEITLWQEDSYCKVCFIGEVVLDLDQSNVHNEIIWYDLEIHDENNGELMCPQRTNAETGFRLHTPSREGSLTWKSLPSIPSTPAHDKVRQILKKKTGKGVKLSEVRQDSDMTGSAPDLHRVSPTGKSPDHLTMRSFSQEDKGNTFKPESKVEKIKRRVSSVMTKVGVKLVDRRSKSLEESEDMLKVQEQTIRRHSDALVLEEQESPCKGKILLTPAQDSRKSSRSSISSVPFSNVTSTATSDMDETSLLGQSRQGPEGDDITSLLGPGQVPPKPSQEKLVQGDLRLGFIITKGQLEIDIICAKGLSKNTQQQLPDTYVKTYLCGNKKRLQKKKTQIIKNSIDPLYRQKVKYSACNVHGRFMQILIKEKCGNFDRNPCLGEVVVKLDNLDLSSHTMGWYKLFKESATEFGSTESF